MLRTLAAALVVAYVPGALILRLPTRGQSTRAALSAEERIFWAVILSTVWSLVVVLALAGLGTYRFERLLLTNAFAAAITVVLARGQLLYSTGAARPTWHAVLPAAILAIGVTTFFPAAEYVMGGKDPGVYLNEGIQIAQRGRLVVADPIVREVPPLLRDLFFPSHQSPDYYGLRFMGFFVDDPEAGTVVGQFPHLFPASIAIGYGLDGLTGARNTIGVWALLGLMSTYFLAAHLFGRAAGVVAALLLSLNVVTVWFARYPNAELPMQAWLLAACLAFARGLDSRLRFFGAVAGGMLGLLLFLRYDAVLAIGAVASAAMLLRASGQRIGFTFALVLMTTGTAGYWYLLHPMRAYSAYPLAFIREQGLWWLVAGAVVAGMTARAMLRMAAVSTAVRRGLPLGMAATFVVLAVYAYFFRQEAGRTALHDAMAFRAFGWYVTPWVLALAVLASAFFVAMRFWRSPAFFVTFATFAIFFFYKTRIVPEHFWTTRRFLAVALPGALIFVAGAITTAFDADRLAKIFRRGHKKEEAAGPLAVAASVILIAAASAPIAGAFWTAATPVRQHTEYAGLIPHLEQLSALVGDRDLLIVEARNAGSDLHALALPLAYIYARNVLVLDSAVPDKRMLEAFVAWADSRYQRVLFLGGGGTDLLTRTLTAQPLESGRFQVPEYDSPVNRYPSSVRRKEFEFGLYELTPATRLPPGPIDLHIGGLDDLNVVRFHARERQPKTDEMYRWTQGVSYVLLQGLDAGAEQVTVWMSNGGRPRTLPPATVEVSLADRVLGTATPIDAVQPFVFPLPSDLVRALAAAGDPVRLRLRVPTWNPGEALRVPDTRDLGVMVTRVEVR